MKDFVKTFPFVQQQQQPVNFLSRFQPFSANSQTVQLFQFSPTTLISLRRFKFDHQFDFAAVRNPITRKLNFPPHEAPEVMEGGK